MVYHDSIVTTITGRIFRLLSLRRVRGLAVFLLIAAIMLLLKAIVYRPRWWKNPLIVAKYKLLAHIYMQSIPPYKAEDVGVIPDSRGIVLTGAKKNIPDVAIAVSYIRDTGCQLPIQFSYLRTEVSDKDLEPLRKLNVSTVDFWDMVKDAKWYKEWFDLGVYSGVHTHPLVLGAAKVHSILAAPFEQILFLDPDNIILRDPTYLFETQLFKKYGALFWPDFPSRPNEADSVMWELMGVTEGYQPELEFETGQIVINKRLTWDALMLATHLCQEAHFYFQHFLGDKEAFFWGFKGTRTPYFLNPNYIRPVGGLVDRRHPGGETSVSVQPDGRNFCGLSMMQSDFYDYNPDTTITPTIQEEMWAHQPQPLFMHWNTVKYNYAKDLDFFQSVHEYVLPRGKTVVDYGKIQYDSIGYLGRYQRCLCLDTKKGIKTIVWHWKDLHPTFTSTFHARFQYWHYGRKID